MGAREAVDPGFRAGGGRAFARALLGPFLLLAVAAGFPLAVMTLDRSNRALPENSAYALAVSAVFITLTISAIAYRHARARRELAEAASAPLDSRLPPARGYGEALWRDFALSARREAAATEAARREEAREGLEAFLATVHALKTPATALYLMAERAESGGEGLDLQALRLELDEMDRLLDRSLGRLRLEDFEQGSRIGPVDAAAAARASVRKHRRMFIARRIQAEVNGSFEAAGDAWWLAFILDQLVSNAAKYASSRVDIVLSSAGSTGRILVADDGPGLDEEDRLRVFARSASGSASFGAERGPSSSGYGLWLAREAAARIGATLELGPGQGGAGTQALLRLPLSGGGGLSFRPGTPDDANLSPM